MIKRILSHLSMVTLASIIMSLCAWGNANAAGNRQDRGKAPDFTLRDVADRAISLADFRGNVVLVNFWASWCPPCRAEIPGFQKVYLKYREKGFVVIGIALDDFGSSLLKELGITYPVARGNPNVLRDYGVSFGIPVSFLVGKDGRIVKKVSGGYSEEELRRDVELALKNMKTTAAKSL